MKQMVTREEVSAFSKMMEIVVKSDQELGFDVVYAVTKTKNKIKSVAEEITEMIENMRKEETKLALKYCARDNDDKPIIKNDRYAGLETGVNPEYDTAIDEFIAKRKAYLKEEIEIEIHEIDKEKIPKKEKAFILETLCNFIKENDE